MERPKCWLKPADQLDMWFDSQGLYRKHTARDSSCLFRAVSEQVLLTQIYHTDVRRQILDYILRHRDLFQSKLNEMGSAEDVQTRVNRLRNHREWAGLLEIYAIARYFRLDVVIRVGQTGEEHICLGYEPRRIMLCQTHDKHYDPLYTKQYITTAAFCQSVVYEMLYKRVFQLKEVDFAVEKMLHDKNATIPRDHLAIYGNSLEEERLEVRDRCTNVKELLELGITPFPYKVAKALDLDIYRNVEFDIWNEYRKGLRYGLCSWNCKDLQIGVKCLVKTPEGETYHGHVQDMQPNKGPVLVYVLDLGEKISVPYECLEVVIPPQSPVPSPSKTWDRPLEQLFDKLKEAASKKNIQGGEESTVAVTSEYVETEAAFSSSVPASDVAQVTSTATQSYQPFPYQQNSNRVSMEEDTFYPDSTKPGVDIYQMPEISQSDEKVVNMAAQRSLVSDGNDLLLADNNPVRFYNLGLEQQMRMNWPWMRMWPVLRYVTQPTEHHQQATPHDPRVLGVIGEEVEPEEMHQPNTILASAIATGRGKSEVYEGVPLIQQYEVSSTTSSVNPLQTVPGAPVHPLYYTQLDVESVPGYCNPGLYLPADYHHPVYEYTHSPVYQPLPASPYHYLPPPDPLYYLPHPPPPPHS